VFKKLIDPKQNNKENKYGRCILIDEFGGSW
jgi:hypothetical protein